MFKLFQSAATRQQNEELKQCKNDMEYHQANASLNYIYVTLVNVGLTDSEIVNILNELFRLDLKKLAYVGYKNSIVLKNGLFILNK